jgi:hypothetical protein
VRGTAIPRDATLHRCPLRPFPRLSRDRSCPFLNVFVSLSCQSDPVTEQVRQSQSHSTKPRRALGCSGPHERPRWILDRARTSWPGIGVGIGAGIPPPAREQSSLSIGTSPNPPPGSLSIHGAVFRCDSTSTCTSTSTSASTELGIFLSSYGRIVLCPCARLLIGLSVRDSVETRLARHYIIRGAPHYPCQATPDFQPRHRECSKNPDASSTWESSIFPS